MKRQPFVLLLLMLCAFGLSLQAVYAQTTTTCPDTLPSRLIVGGQGRVTPGDPNRVRDVPSTSGILIGEIPGAGVFTVLEGPTCAEGYAWWRVDYQGMVGWTAEAGSDYWLEPLALGTGTDGVPVLVDYEGVNFLYDSSAISSVIGNVEPAAPGAAFPMPMGVTFDMSLEGAPETNFAYFNIYRVSDWEAVNSSISTGINELTQILAERPAVPDVPQVRQVMAVQALQARHTYIDFPGGSAVRYITFYHQNVPLINAGGLRYELQGLTSDGVYYIRASINLINVSIFPEQPDFGGLTMEQFDQQAPEYLARAVADLNNAASDVFTPRLETFDALFASLQIGESVLVDAAVTSEQFSYRGVTFDWSTRLSASVEGDFNPAVQDPEDLLPWERLPRRIIIRFYDEDERMTAVLVVYIAEEYEAATGKSLDSLRQFAEERPQIPTPDPVLTADGQTALFVAQPRAVGYVNGRGMRFLVSYIQTQSPILNGNVYYAYTGIASGGTYYVEALFSLTTDLLPARSPLSDPDFDAQGFYDNYDAYLQETIATLEAAEPDAFTPSLDVLDAVFAGLVVSADLNE